MTAGATSPSHPPSTTRAAFAEALALVARQRPRGAAAARAPAFRYQPPVWPPEPPNGAGLCDGAGRFDGTPAAEPPLGAAGDRAPAFGGPVEATGAIAAAQRRLATGEVSATELVERAILAAEKHGFELGAVVELLAEQALAEAARLDRLFSAGRPLGPLHGIPITVKDIIHVAGVPTRAGSAAYCVVPSVDATAVARARAAGAVVVAKVSTHEFALGVTTPQSANPFDHRRIPGGSSGGSAIAVACGIGMASIGTDTRASIRVPAALCGVVGLKPTFGRVPNNPRPDGFRAAALFASGGPLARTVGDVACLLDVLSGMDPTDPFSVHSPSRPMSDTPLAAVKGLKVGISPTFGGFPVDPDVLEVVAMAGAILEDLGCAVSLSDFTLPAPHGELCQLVRRAIGDGVDDTLAGLATQGILAPESLAGLETATAGLVEQARATGRRERQHHAHLRTRLLDEVERAFSQSDVLLGPVSCVRAVPNGPRGTTVGPSVVAGEAVDPLVGWCATWPWNLTGHPAAAVPIAMREGAPVAVQIVGRRHADDLVLSVGAALEEARPWRHWYQNLHLEELCSYPM